MTLKLDVLPESVKAPVWAMTVPDLFTMSMEVLCQEASSIAPVTPLMVAWAPEKLAVPKFAKGKMVPEDGASTIHSAEDRWALADWVVENDCPVVLSLICNP